MLKEISFILLFLIARKPADWFQAEGGSAPREPLRICQRWDAIPFESWDLPPANLRYDDSSGSPSWSFSGQITATCTLSWLGSIFDLAEVRFLGSEGIPQSVWVALGVILLDGTYLPTSRLKSDRTTIQQVFRPGLALTVRTRGKHVYRDGIDWAACQTLACRIGIWVDPHGSISQAILAGIPPRNYPPYGFLFWEVIPDRPIFLAQSNRILPIME